MDWIPEAYRVYLLVGLLGHKVLWEVLRVRAERVRGRPARVEQPGLLKRVLKTGKAGFLLFLIVQTALLDVLPIVDQPATFRWIGLLIFTAGLGLAVAGRLQLGENWANLEDYSVLPDQELVHTGVYRFVRHPIYGGDLLLLAGLELALNSWLVLVVVPISIVVLRQARQEEEILTRAFAGYSEYRKGTKMLVPFVL